MPNDPRDQPNDRFGFAVYAVFAVAAPAQVSAIAEIRRAMHAAAPALPAYVTAPAHVTVKSLFAGVSAVEAVEDAVHSVAESTSPFRVEFFGPPEPRGLHDSSLAVPVRLTPELSALNRSLESVIGPLAAGHFGTGGFDPHMTVFQDATATEVERGMRLVPGLRLGSGFRVESLELMARSSPFRGGRWTGLASFELATDTARRD